MKIESCKNIKYLEDFVTMDPNENRNYPSEENSSVPPSAPDQGSTQLPAGSQPPQYQPPQYDGSSSYQQPTYGQSYQAPQYSSQPYQAPDYQSQSYQQQPQQSYQSQPYQAPQYSAQPYQASPYDMQDQPKRSSGLAIASMVCGILSVVICCGMWISWILSVVAIILGAVSLSKRQGGRGMAIAGIITAVFGLLLSIGFFIFAYAVGQAGNSFDSSYSYYYNYYDDIF